MDWPSFWLGALALVMVVSAAWGAFWAWIIATVLLDQAGWFMSWRIYDRDADPNAGGWGRWSLKSWGPFHRGTWDGEDGSRFRSRWVGVGKRGGFGLTVGRTLDAH